MQKPSGGGCAWDPNNAVTNQASPFAPLPAIVPAGGEYVENHVAIMRYPNTGMVTSTDLGANTHPTNKSGYGHRARDVALGMVYGRPIEYIGPVYDSHQVDGERVRVKFQHVGRGLAQRHGDKLQGFAIAGEDRKFQWADAKIDGDSVVLSGPGLQAGRRALRLVRLPPLGQPVQPRRPAGNHLPHGYVVRKRQRQEH